MAQKMLKYWFQYLRDFWRPLEMPFISCEISFILTRSKNIFFSGWHSSKPRVNIYNNCTKLFVPVVILSIQYNVKRSKITTNWKKYQSKVTKQVQN